jgi:hypothetical protein
MKSHNPIQAFVPVEVGIAIEKEGEPTQQDRQGQKNQQAAPQSVPETGWPRLLGHIRFSLLHRGHGKEVGYSDGAFIGAARSANARHVLNRFRAVLLGSLGRGSEGQFRFTSQVLGVRL